MNRSCFSRQMHLLPLAVCLVCMAAALVQGGEPVRGYLGISYDTVQDLLVGPGIPFASGLRITRVIFDSPARAIGLEIGDVLLAVDGRYLGEVEDPAGLFRDLMAESKPGREVRLSVYRRPLTLTVRKDDEELAGARAAALVKNLGDALAELPAGASLGVTASRSARV
ncbi:PDZ domain-containing protein, partial [bacterium]|nr:PDZ domain-containing protein [candidate division CSSED10-310 bacterium]